ncbi:hypothetical protein LTR37_009935 [Vermiconidia calcicola]|uniref:Uncharacterized protein n=1 Tax=Vermiconidia calcicola TaxID=1690605 RepID=A0ACC3N6G5_9PEZI|nr:hypothetical protein LTR37_009935 [Vermiconidia calcicola]
MASLLSSHLEQISLCATSIADLPFAGPKIFTNALLANHDITSLIRDTEQHERALFHLAPPPLPKSGSSSYVDSINSAAPAASTAGRRQTGYGARQPKNKAVAAVLGGDLYQQTRGADTSRQKGELDVELLLHGAEKLAAVYPIPGANDKITALRRRHQQLAANIAHYETRVAKQTSELQAMTRPTSRSGPSDDGKEADTVVEDAEATVPMTKEDLRMEEQEVRELERKKKGLEERVTGMERDLGGLMR